MKFKRALVLGIAAVLLVSCGRSSAGIPQPATEDGLRDAVESFSNALFEKEFKAAYKFFSDDCRADLSLSEFTGYTMMGMAFLEGMADVDSSELKISKTEIQNFSANSAETRSELTTDEGLIFSSLEDSDWTSWIYEKGEWRTSDCEEFNGDSEVEASSDFFSAPDCSLLSDGKPVPSEFVEEDGKVFNLDCQEGDQYNISLQMTCFFSDREYVSNDIGFVFVDEGIFRVGEVKGCLPDCSELDEGEPVSAIFDDDSAEGFNLNCESPSGDQLSFGWSCFDSDRSYVTSEYGYAFTDDRIFQRGDAPVC